MPAFAKAFFAASSLVGLSLIVVAPCSVQRQSEIYVGMNFSPWRGILGHNPNKVNVPAPLGTQPTLHSELQLRILCKLRARHTIPTGCQPCPTTASPSPEPATRPPNTLPRANPPPRPPSPPPPPHSPP